jgi:hypothetical protein
MLFVHIIAFPSLAEFARYCQELSHIVGQVLALIAGLRTEEFCMNLAIGEARGQGIKSTRKAQFLSLYFAFDKRLDLTL